MENVKPASGADYPRTFEEMDEWFRTETGCRDYIRRVRWPDGFVCGVYRGALDNGARGISMQGVPWQHVADGRHSVPGHPQAVADMVPCDVVHHQSEEWRQRPGLAAGVGPGQLRNSMDVDAQTAQSDGPAGP